MKQRGHADAIEESMRQEVYERLLATGNDRELRRLGGHLGFFVWGFYGDLIVISSDF